MAPKKVVIIGSGPAGWTAAIYAARANLQPVVYEGAIIEKNRLQGTLPLGQLALTTEVENFPGFPDGVMGPELMENCRKQARKFGTEVVTDDIASVDLSRRPFKLTPREGEPFEALSVIVATGARANYLGLPSEERFKNRGVSACAVCDGALPRFRNKPLVVIGGGDSAVEEGTFLTKFASKVYLVHRRGELRASRIMQDRILKNPKVEPKWNSVVDEVLGDDKAGVTGVRIKSVNGGADETLQAAGMFCAIGHTPNTDFLKGQLKLNEKGYILWTKAGRTETSVPGVFAAGDVADDYYKQAISAAGTGCMAALDAERWLAANNLAH
ncbi:MAG TPA: thioredoxin-disulfide reductase [Elusimicrobiota bacterium]|nr:thioredoxin-disulfide reductase [Elusimicrobiota bacterium]